ncbi:MAG: prolipoprotein diacylglyceryl transferase family protein [Pyrinomonadaceae bacterium]
MRPYVVEFLNDVFGIEVFVYLVPNGLIMIAIGVIGGTLYAARCARSRGLDTDVIYGITLWGIPAAIAGTRLGSLLYAVDIYDGSVVAFFDPIRGDNLGYGAHIASCAAAFVYLRVRGADVGRYLDCAVQGVGIGIFFGRLGCFLDGDDFGSVTSALGIHFPPGSLAFLEQLHAGLIAPMATQSLAVHPVQVYLALNGLILAAIAWRWSRREHVAPGEAFWLFWLLYACSRFALEILRGDPSRGFWGDLSTSQAISIGVFLVSTLGFIERRRCRRI